MFFILTPLIHFLLFFFFNDTATTEIYTLSLHDALPISKRVYLMGDIPFGVGRFSADVWANRPLYDLDWRDRKSTRLNSSHLVISYAVFCLKKKKKNIIVSSIYIIVINHTSCTSRIVASS